MRTPRAISCWEQFKAALSIDQNFDYVYWIQVGMHFCFEWFMRLLGPLLLVFATALISVVVYAYFVFILALIAEPGSVAHYLHGAWALFLAGNVFWNYYGCAFTQPGRPEHVLPPQPKEEEEDGSEGEADVTARIVVEEGPSSAISGMSRVNAAIHGNDGNGSAAAAGRPRQEVECGFCKKCRWLKPPRAHHCHVCDQCVLNMDHHCPWVNNCVGYYNYRYFVLFLGYVWVGCTYAVICTAPMLVRLTQAEGEQPPRVDPVEQSAVFFTFVLTLSVGVAVSVLFFWHLYLVGTAQTTIDFYENQDRRARAHHRGELFSNPFDMGMRKNWEQVFGPGPVLLRVLPSGRKPPPPVVPWVGTRGWRAAYQWTRLESGQAAAEHIV